MAVNLQQTCHMKTMQTSIQNPHNHLIHSILSNDFWKGTPWKVNGWNTYKSPMKGKEHEFTNIHDYVPC